MMNPLYPDDFWEASIGWSRPMGYDNLLAYGSNHDETANFYMILGRYSNKPAKILYIGMTFRQWVSKRLGQLDHQKRYAAFIGHNKRHRFQVSHGSLIMKNGNITRNRIEDIEKLLIHANYSAHSRNIKSIYTHGVSGSYLIHNTGYKCTLPGTISLGIFVS